MIRGREGEDAGRRLRRIAVALALVAVAAPFVLLPAYLLPAVVPKVVFFRTLVGLALVLLAVLAVRGEVRLPGAGDPLLWALALFAGVSLVSALSSAAPARSFYGSLERMGGALAWLFYLAFYLVLRGLISGEGWRRLFRASALVSTAVALYVVVRLLGLTPGFVLPGGSPERPAGPLGNPGYLAVYLVLGTALVAWLLLRAEDRRARLLYGAAAFLHLYVLFLAATRAVIAGLLVAALLVGTGALFAREGRARRTGMVLVAAAAAMAGLLLVQRQTDALGGIAWIERLAEVSLDEHALQTRFLAWEAALAGFRESPFLGAGPENFVLVSDRHFDPVAYNLLPGRPVFDRAHNAFLEVLATTGVPGFLAYVGVWAALFAGLLRARRTGALGAAETGVLAFGIAAYLVYLLFWFEDHNSIIPFLAIAAYVGAGASGQGGRTAAAAPGEGSPGPGPGLPGGRWRRIGAGLGVALALALAGIGLVHGVRTLGAAGEAGRAARTLDPWQASGRYRAGLAWSPPVSWQVSARFAREAGWVLRELEREKISAPGPDSARAVLAAALAALDAEERRDPRNSFVRHVRARLLDRAHRHLRDAELGRRAERAVREAIALSPRQVRHFHLLSEILVRLGREVEAREALERALSQYDGFGETYYALARVEWLAGAREEAVDEMLLSYELGYDRQGVGLLFVLRSWLESAGAHGRAAELFRAHLEARYLRDELGRPRREWRTGRGELPALRGWDLPIASSLPVMHVRAGEPEEALEAARLLERLLPARLRGAGAGEAVARFREDVRAGRVEAWRGADGVLEGPTSGRSSGGAGTRAGG